VVTAQQITLWAWDLGALKTVRQFSIEHGLLPRPRAIAFTPDGRRLITGQNDCTALIWDLTGTGRPSGAAAPPLSPDALARYWETLAADDAASAYTAGWELTDRADQSVALIRERLKPIKAADKAAVERLVAQLDSERFRERDAATKSLREMGDSAVPTLKAMRKAGLSVEAGSRVDSLLAAAASPLPASGRQAQQVRAIAILERIGSRDARKLLEELASGLAEARLTREAAEALQRYHRHIHDLKLEVR
jgi:hypothetical protein